MKVVLVQFLGLLKTAGGFERKSDTVKAPTVSHITDYGNRLLNYL